MHTDDCLGATAVARTASDVDRELLERTLDLAEAGRGATRPNPVVGALLARADDDSGSGAMHVLATAYHERLGAEHAERALLTQREANVPHDATLYVSLEPCNHVGRTPPCTDLIIDKGVRRVVYASCDPNPVTAGAGPAKLRAAGIEVRRGPRDVEARALQQNAGFHMRHLSGRPYVTAKWAMTRDGAFATGDAERRWVSCQHSRDTVHRMRAAAGAVLCGIGTVFADDPQLTARGLAASLVAAQPLRVVLDHTLRLPLDSALVRSAREVPVLVCCAHDAAPEREFALVDAGVEVWRWPASGESTPCGELLAVLHELADREINDVLLEAGPRLLDSFSRAQLVDAAVAFVAPFDATSDVELPRLALDHPLVRRALSEPPTLSGDDSLHAVVIHAAADVPGAVAD